MKFKVNFRIKIIWLFFPKNGDPRVLYLKSAATTMVMNNLDFVSFDEEQVTDF